MPPAGAPFGRPSPAPVPPLPAPRGPAPRTPGARPPAQRGPQQPSPAPRPPASRPAAPRRPVPRDQPPRRPAPDPRTQAGRPRPSRPPAAGPAASPAHGPVRAHPVAVLVAIGLGALGVVYLWWSDTPAVSNFGEWVTNAGRVLGLLAGYGVVVLVALMARLPPLDRGVGTDRLARWHAMGGRYIISLITAHALLIIWGYAITAHTNVVSQAVTLVLDYPDVLMATVAAFLLIGVGIVSARAARKRMRYETWYYLHFYTYVAIALAFSHQFAVGADFVANQPARVGWSVLYATVGAAVLWYRVIRPLRRAARHQFRVVSLAAEAPGVVSVHIGGRYLDELHAEPGQFFRWRFLTRGRWWSANPYSLSAMPRPDLMRITVKEHGDHSGGVRHLRPGTRVIAEGPYGSFSAATVRAGRQVLLLAGGVGITPLRAMFAAIPGDVTLVYRASEPSDVVFHRELEAIAQARGARVHYLIGSRAQLGGDPLSARRLAELVPGLHRCEVYVCGPGGMTETAVAELRAAGVPRSRIHYESFEF
jgi:predicted ferric reductase